MSCLMHFLCLLCFSIVITSSGVERAGCLAFSLFRNANSVCYYLFSPPLGAIGRLWFILEPRHVEYEPPHDKTNKMTVRPAKTQISLGIHPVWSESSLSAWRNLGSLATHWVHSEDSDQTGRMPRLTWVFAGRTRILLVLSCRCYGFPCASFIIFNEF